MDGLPGKRQIGRFLAASFAAFLLVGCSTDATPTVTQGSALQQPTQALATETQPPAVDSSRQPEPTPTAPARTLTGSLSWNDDFGPRSLVFETSAGTVKLRVVGHDSLMLQFGSTVVHLNPWSGVADYELLPKADQVWITDPAPEHLDVRAIGAVATASTRLIVDSASARLLQGLRAHFRLQSGVSVTADGLLVQAVQTYAAGRKASGPLLEESNGYLVTFGDFRLFLAGRPHFLDQLQDYAPVDLAVMALDEASGLSVDQVAQAAHELEALAVLPYAYQPGAPDELADLLADSRIVVWPLDSPREFRSAGSLLLVDKELPLPEVLAAEAELDPQTLTDLFRARASDTPLLPDLLTIAPSSLRIVHNNYTEVSLLRLTNSIANAGDGPLEMWGELEADEGIHPITQRIYGADGSYQEIEVGEFIYHPTHGHWHVDSFSLYELWSLLPDGGLDRVVATSGKVSFCLRDISRIAHPNQARWGAYNSCSTTRQGISVGWVDTYQYYLPGQAIDISQIPDGVYALLSTADPANLILESDETNNFAVIYLQIEGSRLTLLDRAEVSSTLEG